MHLVDEQHTILCFTFADDAQALSKFPEAYQTVSVFIDYLINKTMRCASEIQIKRTDLDLSCYIVGDTAARAARAGLE